MNGFYPMLNEIHDKAAKELPLAELALFEHIWRKLIGWGKFEDEISISQLVNETQACKSSIIHILKQLEEKRWIVVTHQVSAVNRKFTNKIAIPACPGIESRLGWSKIQTTPSVESRPGGSAESRHTTDSSSKDNLKTSSTEGNWDIIPFRNMPEAGANTDLSSNERDRVDDFGLHNIATLNRMYYTRSTADTLCLYNLLRVHTPNAIIKLVQQCHTDKIGDNPLAHIRRNNHA